GSTQVINGIDGTAVGVIYDAENNAYYMASTDTTGDRNFYIHKFSDSLVEEGSPWGDAIDFSAAGSPGGSDSVPAGIALFTDVSGEEDLVVAVGGTRSGAPPWRCAAV